MGIMTREALSCENKKEKIPYIQMMVNKIPDSNKNGIDENKSKAHYHIYSNIPHHLFF